MCQYELGHESDAVGSVVFPFGKLLLCRGGKRAATWQFRGREREEVEEEAQGRRIGHSVFQRRLCVVRGSCVMLVGAFLLSGATLA